MKYQMPAILMALKDTLGYQNNALKGHNYLKTTLILFLAPQINAYSLNDL